MLCSRTGLEGPGSGFGGGLDGVSVITEDVVAFEGKFQAVGDAGHVETATEPEEGGHRLLVAEVDDECLILVGSEFPRCPGEFAGVSVGALFGGGEAGPVVAGEASGAVRDLIVIESGDFEKHFTMAHAVVATDGAGLDPEEAFFENAIG